MIRGNQPGKTKMDIATLGLAVDSRPVATANNELDRMVQVGARVEQTTKRAMGTASAAFREATGAVNAHADAYRRREAAADSYLSSLKDEVAMYGKNRAQVEAYKSSLMGLTAEQQRQAVAMGRQLDLMRAQDTQMGAMRATAAALAGAMAAGFAVKQVYDFSRALFDASAEAQRLRTSLDFATGGSGAKELQYVTQLADRLGLQLTTTAQAYSGLAAAARGTSLEGQGARNVFESVTKASAVMGLSAENTSGVLLALQQALSKGTLQAEEIRGQIGERLPGAFQIAARAMGVTTSELGKMLEQGQVLSTDFLPKFARQLEQELGGAAEGAAARLDASINRLDNAWERLKRVTGDSGVSSFMQGQFNILTDGFSSVSDSMEMASMRGEGFAGQMLAGGVAVARFLNPMNAFSYSAQETGAKLKEAEAEMAKLQARGDTMGSNIYYRNELANLAALISELKAAQREKLNLQGQGEDAQSRRVAAEAAENRRKVAEEEARAARDAYLAADIRQTKAQRREEDIAKARKANAAMLAKAEGDSVAQAKLRKALEVEIANINEKHKDKAAPGAAAAARDEANATIAELQRAQAVTEEISRRTIANISAQRAAGTLTEIEAVKLVAAEELKRYEAAETALDKEIAIAATRKDNATQVANLEGQLALAKEKRLTREQQLQLDLAEIERRRAEENRARYNADATRATQELAAMIEANKQAELEIEGIGLTDRELQKLNETRMDSAIARQQEKIAAMQMLDVSGESVDAIDIEIAKLKELQKARGLYSMRTNMQRDAEAGQRFYANMWEGIDRTAHDVFTNVADNGMSAFERIGKTLKASILDMLYRMTVQKWLIQIGASIFGSGFAGAAASALGSAGGIGGIGTAVNGASAISNLFGLGTSAAGLVGSGVGAIFGGTAGNAALAASLGLGSGSAAAAASGASIAAGGTAAGAGLGASIGAAIPYIGAALLALSVLGKGFKGETRTGGQFGVAYDGQVTNERRGQTYTYQGQQFDRDFSGGARNALVSGQAYRLEGDPVAQESAIRGAVAGTAAGINAMLKALGSAQQLAGFSAGFETSGKGRGGVFAGGKFLSGLMFGESGKGDNYAGTLYEATSTQSPDFQTAVANFTLDLKQATIQALQTVDDIPATIKAALANVDAEALTEQEVDALIKTISDTINGVENLRASFEAMGLDKFAQMGFDAAAALAAAAGGFDKLQSNLSSFYQNYYSEEERKANLQEQIAKRFKALGLEVPATAAEYRAATEAALERAQQQDKNRAALTGSIGAAIGAGVAPGNFAGSVGSMLPAVANDPAARKVLDSIFSGAAELAQQGKSPAEIQASVSNMIEMNAEVLGVGDNAADTAAALLDMNDEFLQTIDTAEKIAERERKARDDAYRALEQAVAEEKKTLQTRLDVWRETAAAASEVFDLLHTNVRELRGETVAGAAMQSAQGRALIANALNNVRATGYLPDAKQLGEAIGAVRGGMGAEQYTSRFTYDRDRAELAAQLAELGDHAQDQLTEAERQILLIEEQISQLDKTLEFWKKQIDIANGTYKATLSVTAAIEALTKLAFPEVYNTKPDTVNSGKTPTGGDSGGAGFGPGAGGTSTPAKIDPTTGKRTFSDGSVDYLTENELDLYRRGILGTTYASTAIPKYDVGTNYVEGDQLAMLHDGEAVVPKKYNPAAGGMGGDMIVGELQRLGSRLDLIEANTRSGAVHGNTTARLLTRLTPQNDALQVRVVTP